VVVPAGVAWVVMLPARIDESAVLAVLFVFWSKV
jgi:hypothetical protein